MAFYGGSGQFGDVSGEAEGTIKPELETHACQVVAMFGTDKISELMEQPLEQLKKLGDGTGSWLYSTIRGEDNSEVNTRTQIKSMLSAKSFRPSINSFEQGVRWLRIFAADIFSRCVEEGVLENIRRPKTIVLHHRQGAQTRSRSAQIPQGKPLSEITLFDLAKNLLAQVVVDGRAWPCANLSLSVGGFEDGPKNNAGIGSFLVRGDDAKAIMSSDRVGEPPAKRRRTKGNIANFFGPRDEKKKDFDAARAVLMKAHSESTRDETEDEIVDLDEDDAYENIRSDDVARPTTPVLGRKGTEEDAQIITTPPSAQPQQPSDTTPPPQQSHDDTIDTLAPRQRPPAPVQTTLDTFFCARCNLRVPKAEEAEHVDYHFALDLSKEMRHKERNPLPAPKGQGSSRPGRGRPPGSGGGSRGGRGGGAAGGGEKGQKTLFFG